MRRGVADIPAQVHPATSSPLSASSADPNAAPLPPASLSTSARKTRRRRKDGRETRVGSPSPVARKLSWTPPPPSPPQHDVQPSETPLTTLHTVGSFAEADAIESDDTYGKWGPSGEATFSLIPPPALARSPAAREKRRRSSLTNTKPLPLQDARRASGNSANGVTSPTASSNALEVSPPTDVNLSPSDEGGAEVVPPVRRRRSNTSLVSSDSDKDRQMRSIRDALHAREVEASNATRFKDFLMSQLRQMEEQNAFLLNECEEERTLRAGQQDLTRFQLTEMHERLHLVHEHYAVLITVLPHKAKSHKNGRQIQQTRELAEEQVQNASLRAQIEDLEQRQEDGSDRRCDALEGELARQRRLCDTLQEQLVKESATRHKLALELRKVQSPGGIGASPQRVGMGGLTTHTPPRKPEVLHASLLHAEDEIRALQKEIEAANSNVLTARAERDASIQKLAEGKPTGLQEQDVTIALLRADVSGCRENARNAKQQLAKAAAKEETLQEILRERDAEIEQLKSGLSANETQLSELRTVQSTHKEAFEDRAMVEAALAASDNRLKAAMADAQQRSMELEMERAKFEEAWEKMLAAQGTATDEKARAQRLAVAKEQLQQKLDDILLQGSSEAAAVASRLAIAERVASERKDDASSAKESARTLSESVRHLTSIRDNLHQQMEDLKKDKEQETEILTDRLQATERRMHNLREEKSSLRATFDAALQQTALDLKQAESEVAQQRETHRGEVSDLQAQLRQMHDSTTTVREALSLAERENRCIRAEAEKAASVIATLRERVSDLENRSNPPTMAALLQERSYDSMHSRRGVSSEDKPLPFAINDSDVLFDTKRLLSKADTAIAAERDKVKHIKNKLFDTEAINVQLSREAKVLRYRVQVLTTALQEDGLTGDLSETCIPNDTDSVASSAVSGLTTLRRELRDKSDQLARLQTGDNETDRPSFESMVGHMADLKRRHSGVGPSIGSGGGGGGGGGGSSRESSPRKRRAHSASGSWRSAISPMLSCSSVRPSQ